MFGFVATLKKGKNRKHRLTKQGRICYIRNYLKMGGGWGEPQPPSVCADAELTASPILT